LSDACTGVLLHRLLRVNCRRVVICRSCMLGRGQQVKACTTAAGECTCNSSGLLQRR
jgi:hypothetical protein